MKKIIVLLGIFFGFEVYSQSYPPQAEQPGSTAIFKESTVFVGWATGIEVERGLIQKSNPEATANGSNRATAGVPQDALGFPDGNTVSLGDEGMATLTFGAPIFNGGGFDFAVFENGPATFLELAFVEVSSNGIDFFRFPAHSQTQTTTQLGPFATPLATYLNNLAGKYSSQYATPFDLSDLPDDVLLNKENITHVRIVDVVGTIDPEFATFDSFGNMVNDPFPTPFASGGFDLQAVGVIHQKFLGVNDNQMKTFTVYPNPVDDFFAVDVENPAQITLFDALGRLVLQQQYSKGQNIDVSGLLSGIYVLQVTSDGINTSQKIIIK